MFDLFGLERPHAISDGDEARLLTTVNDVVLLGVVRGILEDASIPYLARERGTGSAMRIMTGFSVYGADIFVPAALWDQARELITGVEGREVAFTDDDGRPISAGEAAERAAGTDGERP